MGKITIDKRANVQWIELINHDKHHALSLAGDIVQLAKPLASLGIYYFNQIRIYKDGSRISIGTHPDWLMHFFKNKYYLKGRFSKNGHRTQENKAILWHTVIDDGIINIASEQFNINNGYTIIKHGKDYNDYFLFASSRENFAINTFYLNHRNLLENFIAFFQEKNESLLLQCKPDTPIYNICPGNTLHEDTGIAEQAIEGFLKEIKPKKFNLYKDGYKISISAKEYQCLIDLIQNKNIKAIAKRHHNMPSTIYRHIENLKNKLQLFSTQQIIDLAKDNFT